jgi:N-acetylglucosaminyl-diphospho-decaprenol L-rhamnosyltransferase
MPDIGIVIITYNSGKHIDECLDAAMRTGAEIVVVDNASTDPIRVPSGVKLIANSTNRGFAAAANQGFASLSTPYVLLLNPDAVIQTSLDPLREACDLPGAAAAGGKLVDSTGSPQIGFMVRRLPTPASLIAECLFLNRVWPRNPINRRYRALDLDPDAPARVEQPAGAFLMIRRAVWEELGGFDECYAPLWFEDVDFCRRLADREYNVHYTPLAVAKHTGAHSIQWMPLEIRWHYWYCSFLRYSAKHFPPLSFRTVCLAAVTGSVLRGIAESALRRSLRPLAAGVKIARLAGRALVFGWISKAVR